MNKQGVCVWNQLKLQENPRCFGLANTILVVSEQKPPIGNIVELSPEGAAPLRSCDINDLFKSQLCLFTNITQVPSGIVIDILENKEAFAIISSLEQEVIVKLVKGRAQFEEQNAQNNKKKQNLQNPSENMINLFRNTRKAYKEQIDQVGKISQFKHPPLIAVQIFFPNQNIEANFLETPFVSRTGSASTHEFISYHHFENDPIEILQGHLAHIVAMLRSNLPPSVFYFNDQYILPLTNAGLALQRQLGKVAFKPNRRLITYKERFQKILYEHEAKLMNVHHFLSPKALENSQRYMVRGDYSYFHYMQDGFDDRGWGCAYRSFMTVLSWIIENGYSKAQSIPNHQQMQKLLVELGDKRLDFVGTNEWIGAFEVNLLIQKLTGIDCRILNVQKGSQVVSNLNEFRNYFINHGAPIMFGGGLYAYTLLGVEFNEEEARFLILDPHYVGNHTIKNIIEKQGVAWKKADIFSEENFYNFCMPLVE